MKTESVQRMIAGWLAGWLASGRMNESTCGRLCSNRPQSPDTAITVVVVKLSASVLLHNFNWVSFRFIHMDSRANVRDIGASTVAVVLPVVDDRQKPSTFASIYGEYDNKHVVAPLLSSLPLPLPSSSSSPSPSYVCAPFSLVERTHVIFVYIYIVPTVPAIHDDFQMR